jgi:hypothetical protein
MTPEQIDLVRKSFDALWPFRRKLAEQFYGRFFELAPDTRRLFPNDMERQRVRLKGGPYGRELEQLLTEPERVQ